VGEWRRVVVAEREKDKILPPNPNPNPNTRYNPLNLQKRPNQNYKYVLAYRKSAREKREQSNGGKSRIR